MGQKLKLKTWEKTKQTNKQTNKNLQEQLDIWQGNWKSLTIPDSHVWESSNNKNPPEQCLIENLPKTKKLAEETNRSV